MKISGVIVEDLQVAADYLSRCCAKSGLVEVVGHFTDVSKALDYLNEHRVDLLFLDVEMPGATGFELLDNISYRPHVILTTSKEEYAFNAFQYHVQDFLKKPFTYARFVQSLEKVMGSAEKLNEAPIDHVFIKSDGRLVRLNYQDILFIESVGNYVRFVTEDKKYLALNSIKNLEDRFAGETFMKVHRSYIVNLLKIDDIRENDLYIKGIEIPISKSLKPEVLKKLTIL